MLRYCKSCKVILKIFHTETFQGPSLTANEHEGKFVKLLLRYIISNQLSKSQELKS